MKDLCSTTVMIIYLLLYTLLMLNRAGLYLDIDENIYAQELN